MRGSIPDHRKRGFSLRSLRTNEPERFCDDDFRGIARELLECSLPTHNRILVEKIGDREPLVESKSTGAVTVCFQDRHSRPTQSVEVPLPKMAGSIPRPTERHRQSLLLLPQGEAMTLHPGPVVGPPSQNRCPRRGAHRPPCIKPVKAQSPRRHRVKVGGPESRVLVIACLPPSHVICHDKDNVGLGSQEGRKSEE